MVIVTLVVLVVLPEVPVNMRLNVPVVAVVAGVARAWWQDESPNPSAAVRRIPIAYRWRIPALRLRSISTIKPVRSASPASHPIKG